MEEEAKKAEEMRQEEANRALRARQEEAEELKRQEAERSRQREMTVGWSTKPVTAPESETKQEPSVKAPVEVAAKPEVKKAATWKKVTPQRVQRMDLSAVSEIKRGANGAVEVKFVDRVKALGVLYEMLGSGGEDETEEFLQALEQAGEERDDWRA